MTLVRWSPWRDIVSVQDEMNRMFDGLMRHRDSGNVGEWMPAVDISETDDEFIVAADVPGMKSEDIKLDKSINEKVWEHGCEKPPRKIRIRAMKFEDGQVQAELAEE